MNLGELLNQVSHKMSMSDAAGSADETFLVRAANSGVRQVLQETRCYVVRDTLSLTAGTSEYTLDADYIALLEASNEGDDARSTFSLVQADYLLERKRRQLASSTARRYTLIGSNLLIVEPTPDTATSITLYVVPAPANELADRSDDPSDTAYGGIPEFGHRAIEMWMCMEAAEKMRQFDAVEYYRKQYDKEIVDTRKVIRGRASRRLAPPRVGYPDYQGPLGRNDVYPGV